MKKNGLIVVLLCSCFITGCSEVEPVETTYVGLDTVKEQLKGTQRSQGTRLEAAKTLLHSEHPGAIRILRVLLQDSTRPASQIAIADAMVMEGIEHDSFVLPLVAMIKGKDIAGRRAAANALVHFRSETAGNEIIRLASDVDLAIDHRLAVIHAMSESLNRKLISALIELLKEKNSVIRKAVVHSLEQITQLNGFGEDYAKWSKWWRKYKLWSRNEWLEYAAKTFSIKKTLVYEENVKLRKRLVTVARELYHTESKQKRIARLSQMFVDPLADIRLLGLTLADTVVMDDPELLSELKPLVISMLDDKSPNVRKSAVLLLTTCGGKDALGRLIDILEVEKSIDVRVGVYRALGRLKDSSSTSAVLKGISHGSDSEASAASNALGHIFSVSKSVSISNRLQIVMALKNRYIAASTKDDNTMILRESLLSTMGQFSANSFIDIMKQGLKDESAIIRRVCVVGLTKGADIANARAISELINDTDRGIRQVVISALMKLNGIKYINMILKHADVSVESDPVVRKQAADAVLVIAKKLKADEFPQVFSLLGKKPEGSELRIGLLQQYIALLRKTKPSLLPAALYEFGAELMKTGRSVEATAPLNEALDLVRKSKPSKPTIDEIWTRYIDSMMISGDIELGTVIANCDSKDRIAIAVLRLKWYTGNIKELDNLKNISMINEVLAKAGKHISDDDLVYLEGKLDLFQAKRLLTDLLYVQKLLSRISSDGSPDAKSLDQIVKMGERALLPLLEDLKTSLAAKKIDTKMEKVIVDLVAKINSDMGKYPITGDLKTKQQTVDSWIGSLKKTK